MIRLINAALILALIGLISIAYADQTCNIKLSNVSKIGDVEFQPGEYKLSIDTPKVSLTHVNSGKEVELQAKVEQSDAKFDVTSIYSTLVDGGSKITEIRIGGSKTRVTFD